MLDIHYHFKQMPWVICEYFIGLLWQYIYALLQSEHCKRDDFIFPIVNFPFIDSNKPAARAYNVNISQLIASVSLFKLNSVSVSHIQNKQ